MNLARYTEIKEEMMCTESWADFRKASQKFKSATQYMLDTPPYAYQYEMLKSLDDLYEEMAIGVCEGTGVETNTTVEEITEFIALTFECETNAFKKFIHFIDSYGNN